MYLRSALLVVKLCVCVCRVCHCTQVWYAVSEPLSLTVRRLRYVASYLYTAGTAGRVCGHTVAQWDMGSKELVHI